MGGWETQDAVTKDKGTKGKHGRREKVVRTNVRTRGNVPLSLRGNIMDSAEPTTLHTASGLTDYTLCVSQQIVGLHETVEP